jgi:hypothetical protein
MYAIYGPYAVAIILVVVAVVVRQRDLASTRQYWIMMGTAGAIALGYTGFIVAIWREYR